MARSRQRLADFEARSVQIIAACTLGLAGMSSVHTSMTHRAGAHTPAQSATTVSALPAPYRSAPWSTFNNRTDRR